MRRGTHGVGPIKLEDGTVIGFGLGADFTSEHEWGIKNLNFKFGVGEGGKHGVESRTITRVPEDFGFNVIKGVTQFYCFKPYGIKDNKPFSLQGNKEYRNLELDFPKPWRDEDKTKPEYATPTTTAWDENTFGVCTKDPEIAQLLKDIAEAIPKMGVTMTISSGPFLVGATGLTFILIDRLPQAIKDNCLANDLAHVELMDAWKKTGIEEELRAAGRKWFYLGPKSFTDETKTDFKVWLNPQEQNKTNFGWFGLAELRQWVKGEGPIPMTDEQIAKRNSR